MLPPINGAKAYQLDSLQRAVSHFRRAAIYMENPIWHNQQEQC